MKKCGHCLELKGAEMFFKQSKSADGLQNRCKSCHALTRGAYSVDRSKTSANNKKYAASHGEAIAKRMAEWWARNLDGNRAKARLRQKTSYKRNAAKALAASAAWRKRNPDHFRELSVVSSNARRARERGVTGRHTRQERRYLLDSYIGRCVYCFSSKAEHFDHVTPLSRGGSNSIDNLAPACAFCNMSKGAKSLLEFLIYRKAA